MLRKIQGDFGPDNGHATLRLNNGLGESYGPPGAGFWSTLPRLDVVPREVRRSPEGDRVPPRIPAPSRKPGGRHRAGQRSAGRNPPNPKTPVDPRVILRVLERKWHTPSGWPNMYRVRSLAALAVALAVPPGTSSIELCAMRPSDVARLKMPEAGWRWVRQWFRHRALFVDGIQGELTSWLAIPPVSNGRPKQIGWALTQSLSRAGAPPWRFSALLRTRWVTSRHPDSTAP